MSFNERISEKIVIFNSQENIYVIVLASPINK